MRAGDLTGGPAFPCAIRQEVGSNFERLADGSFSTQPVHQIVEVSGMTLLDYFAGQMLASNYWSIAAEPTYQPTYKTIASECYDLASAMLAEKRKREEVENEFNGQPTNERKS